MKLGKIIREIREDQDLDQTEFAKILNCSQSYVSKIEKGWIYPNVYFLELLRATFYVDLNYLFDHGEID